MTSLLTSDALAFATSELCAVALAEWARPLFGEPPHDMSMLDEAAGQFQTLFLLFCCIAVYLAARGCYRERLPYWTEIRRFVQVSVFALLAQTFLTVAFKDQPSRLNLIAAWVLFPGFVALMRPQIKRILEHFGLWGVPILVIGDPPGTATATEVFGSERYAGYKVVSSCEPADALRQAAAHGWRSLLRSQGARRIVLVLRGDATHEPLVIQSILREGLPFAVLPSIDVLPVVGFEPIPFFSHDTMMLCYRNNLAQPAARLAKIAVDLILAALLLALLAPLFLVIIVLVRRDGGSAFFSHERIGARGRRFGCLKFRSMAPDAQAVLLRALGADPALAEEWAATQKLRCDPRVTRIGRVLRATSLDELPQLLNVLRLEMSLVGPRPIVADEIARYGDDITFYYEARPGLTGLWQVSGRAETTYNRRVKLDCWYVKNWTMWHDIAILSKTIPAVFSRRGAR